MLFILVIPGLAWAGNEGPWDMKAPFESATVQYTLKGMETGTETLYIRDYGKRTARHHAGVTSMLGMKMENTTLELVDPDWIYTYNLKDKTGTKRANPVKYMKEEYEKLTPEEKKQVEKNSKEVSVNIMQGGGGSLEENVTEMLGYKVDKGTFMGITSYNIHNSPIAMKTEGTMMGMRIDVTATSVEEGKIDDQFFAHPEDIEAVFDQRADDMSRSMAKSTMDWLKDPEAARKSPPSPMQAAMGGGESSPQEEQEQENPDPTSQIVEGMLKGLFGN